MATQVSKKLPYVVLKTPSYGIDPTIRVFDKVRKTPFSAMPFSYSKRSFYQDRLGTNTGEVVRGKDGFCRR